MDAASVPPSPIARTAKRRTKLTKPEQYRDQILQGLDRGKSQRQVAAELGISHSSISSWLDTIDQEKQQLARFRSNRADVLSQLQSRAISLQLQLIAELERDGLAGALTPSQKSGLLHTLTVVSGTAYDKERLETGQSTSNQSVVTTMINAQVSSIYTRMCGVGTKVGRSTVSPAHRKEAERTSKERDGTPTTGSAVLDTSGSIPGDKDSSLVLEEGGPGGMGDNSDTTTTSPPTQSDL